MELFSETDKIELEIHRELKTVIDPELNINIIDLGLVYKIHYSHEEGIKIEMTLSSRGCPLGDVIIQTIIATLEKKFPGKKVDVQLVWEPVWSSVCVTPDGRKMLGMAPTE